MKLKDKTNLFHLIWGWISVGINLVITWVLFGTNELEEPNLLVGLAAIAVWCVAQGISSIIHIINVKSLSLKTVVIQYVSEFVFFCLLVYIATTNSSVLCGIAIILAMLIETGVAALIPYRYRIVNKFKEYLHGANNSRGNKR